MNPVETILALTRYLAPLKVFSPEEHDLWRQYLSRSPAQRQQEDHDLITAFRQLSRGEAADLAHRALELYDECLHTDTALPCEILTQIASFVDEGLRPVYREILARRIIFLPALYRGADATTRDALMAHIHADEPNEYDFGRRVEALAWVGDAAVQHQMLHWRQHLPAWHASRYVRFADFETEAGWELTPEGHRRNLYVSQAYELIPWEPSHLETTHLPIGTFISQDARCGWCGRSLETLFDLDLTDARLQFWPVRGIRLRIACCLQCSWYKHLYTDIDFDGHVSWSQGNEALQEQDAIVGWEPMTWTGGILVLGLPRRTPFELQGALFAAPCSQLGGVPSWVQWAEFPRCPSCTRRMLYVGQVEATDVIEQGEGVLFGFLCVECRKAATVFQQT
jgi:hypothetical protein